MPTNQATQQAAQPSPGMRAQACGGPTAPLVASIAPGTCRHETNKRGGEGKYNWGAEGDEAAYGAGADAPELEEDAAGGAVATGGDGDGGDGAVDTNGVDAENAVPAEPEVRARALSLT